VVFKLKKISVSRRPIGTRLKLARRRKRFSLEEVEEITKVKKRYLEDIERNNFDNLPSEVYTKGFLAKYAEAVGLNSKKIVDSYKLTRGTDEDNSADHYGEFAQKTIKNSKFSLTPKLVVTLIFVLLFIGLAGYLFIQVRGFASAPVLEITKPEQDKLSTTSSGLTIEGKTDPGASVFINDQPISCDLSGNFSESVRLRDGINEIKVSAKNKINRESSKIINVSVKLPVIAKNGSVKGAISGLKLVVKIGPNPSWLSVDVDGKRVFQGIMLKETSQEFLAEKDITVSIGNAGSAHLYLNNKDLGVQGKEGEVRRDLNFNLGMVQ